MNGSGRTPSVRPFLSSGASFAAGDDTPRAFLERCLEAYAAWEPQIGAFVHTNFAAARAAADAATARWQGGKPLSAIDGMPIGVKDIIQTEDMPTEMGSPLFAGWRSGWDAASVAALREAGAVIIGKTVTTEFAASHPRGTRNPHDVKRTPGGSSSGSAAAAGAGVISAGLGTQVIGSIVRPASYCGCVGYKPTVGSINRGGSLDYLSQSCTGVLAATVQDAWQVAIEIAARVGGDPGLPGLDGPMQPPAPVKPRTLALLETAGWRVASPEAKAALEAAVERLKAAGVKFVTRSSHPEVEAVEEAITESVPVSTRINDWEWRWPLNSFHERDASKLSRVMLDRMARTAAMRPDDYRAALAERTSARTAYAKLAGICDGGLTLTAPGAAPTGLESTGNPIFAVPFSMLGVPAISLPLLREQNLPLGLQHTGFAGQDAAAIGIAAWLVRTLGGEG
jgi:Asp-tRNA(Asn)/Glu-tRNA(Gln) amidotransferase A subunit family amidase